MRERKNLVKRAHRHLLRQALRRDYEDERFDFLSYPYIEISEIVSDRRGADKTAPLVRWALRSCVDAGIPREEREDRFRSLLPDNLIGRHARSHLKVVWDDDWDDNLQWAGNKTKEYYRQEARVQRLELEQKLHGVIANGRLAELNRAIKRVHQSARYYRSRWGKETASEESHIITEWFPGHQIWIPRGEKTQWYQGGFAVSKKSNYRYEPCRCRPRCLAGAHDVETFVERLRSEPKHPEWGEAVKKFLES
jgi:hypothetical protein